MCLAFDNRLFTSSRKVQKVTTLRSGRIWVACRGVYAPKGYPPIPDPRGGLCFHVRHSDQNPAHRANSEQLDPQPLLTGAKRRILIPSQREARNLREVSHSESHLPAAVLFAALMRVTAR